MVRIPMLWLPGFAAGFIIIFVLGIRGVLPPGLFGRLMSMAILLGCALAGKLLIENVKRKRDARPSPEFLARMQHIDEFNRQMKALKGKDEKNQRGIT
ncbi:MAG: hypothetical protein EPN93_07590 [Spirochaetes bacterium]|nr:MAG: hypothetical protein EPN93_07590 [Spirochaetota bacterium]